MADAPALNVWPHVDVSNVLASGMLRTLLIALALTLTTTAVAAKPSIADKLEIKSETFRLKNGLTVVVHEDKKAPIVAINVWYHVGSKDELPGRSGFAHLFEHLMFNGSEHFNTDYFKALGAMGATDLNGTTNRDRTNYFQTVPKGGLDRVLFLESDRMGHLLGAIDQARLDEQRGVVQNEKRQGENRPYGLVFNEANKVLFPSHHPYAFPRGTVIGSMEDLDAATLKDVHEWFKTWYGPQNAVVVLAGDITVAEAKAKAEKFFGHIPAGPPQPRHGAWAEQLSHDVKKVLEDRVPQARLYRMWVAPAVTHDDSDALDLAALLLGDGKTSRLYQRLVVKDQLCTDVSAGLWAGEIAGQFMLIATAKPDASMAAIEKAIDEEVASFLKAGPKAPELERQQTATLAAFARGLERVGGFGGKSDILASSAVYFGDANAWKGALMRTEKATTKQVQSAAQRWLGAPKLDLVVQPFGTYENASAGVDRKKMPELEVTPVTPFPTLKRATLKNGLKVVLVERKGVPVVDVRLSFGRGSSGDNASKAGLAQLAMNMLDEGTKKRSATQIAEAADGLGASLSTWSGLEDSGVTLRTLRATLDGSLALFGEVVLQPSFPQADFERTRQQQLANITQELNNPNAIAARLAPKLVFGASHTYALPRSGVEASVKALTRDDVAAWYAQTAKAGSSTVFVAGDLTLDQVVPMLEKAIGGLAAGEAPAVAIKPAQPPAGGFIYLVDRPGSVQSIIFAGHATSPLDVKKEVAIESMNRIIGGDFMSRLNMNLREDKHWSYGVRSSVQDSKGPRMFSVTAPVQTDKTSESVAEVHKELTAFVGKAPVNVEEFNRVQDDRVLRLAGQWETIAAVQSSVAWQVGYGFPDDYFQGMAERLRALKRDDITAAAKDVIKPGQLVWIVVGDRSKIEAGLRALKLGEVKVIAAE